MVFSNILEKHDSIFFFRRWQNTYGAFQRRIRKHYQGGMCWVGDFDLAAFLQRVAGYALTGDTSEECLFFIHGGGGTLADCDCGAWTACCFGE